MIPNNEITFNSDWLNGFCGTDLSNDNIQDILNRLEIDVVKAEGNDITVHVAPHRSDVLRPVDIAEEILRIYGFNQVEIPKRISMTPSVSSGIDIPALREKVSDFLVKVIGTHAIPLSPMSVLERAVRRRPRRPAFYWLQTNTSWLQ